MSMLPRALDLAAKGLHIFPLYEVVDEICACMNLECKSPGKHPRTGNGGLYHATNNPEQITLWWTQWPNANIGIKTGGDVGIIVLDVDDKENKRGLDSLSNLGYNVEQFANVVRTGSGGYHIYFSYDKVDLKNRQGMMPGLDLRGLGGYVVGPGSLHLSGEAYTVIKDGAAEPIPPELFELFKKNNQQAGKDRASKKETLEIGEGGRDGFLIACAGKLRRHGFEYEEILPALAAINKNRCKPPKADSDIERLARNVCKYAASAPITQTKANLYALIKRSTLVQNMSDISRSVLGPRGDVWLCALNVVCFG